MITVVDSERDESLIGDVQLNVKLRDLKPTEIRRRLKEVPKTIQQKGVEGKEWFFTSFLEISYLKLHVAYFLLLSILGSIIIYLAEIHNTKMDFIDAIFLAVSSLCVTGLSSVDIGKLNTGTHVIVLILLQLGSVVTLTLTTLVVRRYFFRKRFFRGDLSDLAGLESQRQRQDNSSPMIPTNTPSSEIPMVPLEDGNESTSENPMPRSESLFEININVDEVKLNEMMDQLKIRELEYSALGRLMVIVILYMLTVYTLGFIVLIIYFNASSSAREILKNNGDYNLYWWSFYHVVTAFNNAGFSLFSNNLVPFVADRFILLVLSIIIILGNTGFPIVLRLIIFACRRFATNFAPYKILLVRPRSLFTHLFPATETRLLTLTWLLMTIAQFVLVMLLSSKHPALLTQSTATGVLNAWFITISTRTAGFNTLDLADLQQGVLVLFVVMMYIAAYPFVVTLHRSIEVPSVYVNQEDEEAETAARSPLTGLRLQKKEGSQATKSLLNAISFHTQTLFFQHIVWLIIVWFIITAIEASRMSATNSNYDIFKILFEIASSYGTVGLSLGAVGIPSSYSTILKPFSKFLMCTVMFLGRHRGLPTSLDPAIQLYQQKKEGNRTTNNPYKQELVDNGKAESTHKVA